MKITTFLPDLILTIPIILLLSLGILIIYSSDPTLAIYQAIFALIGLIIYFFISNLEVENFGNYLKYFYLGIIFLLLIVFFIGVETRGSWRWISLGPVSLQPSEFAKPILILILARFWSSHLPNFKNILISALIILPLFGLIYIQPDLGTALTIFVIWFMMLLAANISILKIAAMSVVAVLIAPLGWTLLKDYQRARISSFLFPSQDPLGVGYNAIQSTIAVGSGQLLGRGLGHGTQSRLQFLPEHLTDFIFSFIAEELGFLGSLTVLSLYGIIIGRCLMIINSLRNRFYTLLIFGVLGTLIFQIVVNIGMNIGIMPVTGITLPLLSYGGSSLITTLISFGFIASAARMGSKRLNFSLGL